MEITSLTFQLQSTGLTSYLIRFILSDRFLDENIYLNSGHCSEPEFQPTLSLLLNILSCSSLVRSTVSQFGQIANQ